MTKLIHTIETIPKQFKLNEFHYKSKSILNQYARRNNKFREKPGSIGCLTQRFSRSLIELTRVHVFPSLSATNVTMLSINHPSVLLATKAILMSNGETHLMVVKPKSAMRNFQRCVLPSQSMSVSGRLLTSLVLNVTSILCGPTD